MNVKSSLKSWRIHPTKKRLYRDLLPVSAIIRERHLPVVGYCWQIEQELVRDLLLRMSKNGWSSKHIVYRLTHQRHHLNNTGPRWMEYME